MTSYDTPTSSSKSSSIWYYDDCTMQIGICKMPDYTGNTDKIVFVMFMGQEAVNASSPSTSSRKMIVKASASCGDYNHVGKEWTKDFFINGTAINTNSEFTVAVGDKITVSARITEHDKYPDEGNGSTSHTVTQADLDNGFSLGFGVDVCENKGRYSGCVASWSVVFKFS